MLDLFQVYRIQKKGNIQFGIVTENAEFSDDNDDDEDSEPEDKV